MDRDQMEWDQDGQDGQWIKMDKDQNGGINMDKDQDGQGSRLRGIKMAKMDRNHD